VIIRNEVESDVEEIARVTRAAFEHHQYSRQTEQFIVAALRAAGALAVSLVAEVDGRVVGHVAFSPVTMSDGSRDWYGVGPLSVTPELQRRGIGSALMRAGLSELKALGASGCVLVGDPTYYERFGFSHCPELVHEGIPQEYFVALSFGEAMARGVVHFHPGFSATA
jgi:putative acetyltransferase